MIPHLLFGSQIDVAVQVVNVAFGLLGSVETAYHTSNWSHTRSRPHKRYVVFGWVQYPYTKPKQSSVVQGDFTITKVSSYGPHIQWPGCFTVSYLQNPWPPLYFRFLHLCQVYVGEHILDENTDHKVVPFHSRELATFEDMWTSKIKICELHCK